MSQFYTDPSRETDPYALPNAEVFYIDPENAGTADCCECSGEGCDRCDGSGQLLYEPGWYWQAWFPGCMPDGESMGPFETKAEAIADAREGCE